MVGEKAWAVATQEATILRHLHHAHIVELVECVEKGGVLYMVMECLEGGALPPVPRRRYALGWTPWDQPQ